MPQTALTQVVCCTCVVRTDSDCHRRRQWYSQTVIAYGDVLLVMVIFIDSDSVLMTFFGKMFLQIISKVLGSSIDKGSVLLVAAICM